MEPLTEREVNEIQSRLTSEQLDFLRDHSKRGKKSKWLEILSQKKGIAITEEMTEDEIEDKMDSWVLREILDGGFGNRPYRCECGNPLRFQYIVYHTEEKKTYKLGVTCLENYTNLSSEIIADIKKGFHTVDLERDEILLKYVKKEFFNLDKFLYIETLPNALVEQVRVGLPLTDNQVEKVYRLKADYDRRVLLDKVYGSFNDEQQQGFDRLPRWFREEIVEKVIVGVENPDIPEGFENEEIFSFLELGFPLLDRHRRKIDEFLRMGYEQERITSELKVRPQNRALEMTYEELLRRHLDTLQKVRENQERIPRGLQRDWLQIQEMVRQLKIHEPFDYSSFKLNLNNLLYALKIKPDPYL